MHFSWIHRKRESFDATILLANGNDNIDFAAASGVASIDLGVGNNTVNTEYQRINPLVDGTNFSIRLGKGNNTIVQNLAKYEYEYEYGAGAGTIRSRRRVPTLGIMTKSAK
jgi:hypothetical protein